MAVHGSKNISTIIRAAIMLAWLSMIGILVYRTYFDHGSSYARERIAAAQLRPREEWMGIYWGKDKVGYSVSRIKKAQEGYQIHEQALMDLMVMGTAQRIDTEVTSLVDNTFTLKSFTFRMFSNLFSFRAAGRVKDLKLQLELVSGGSSKSTTIDLEEVPCLASSLKPLILAEGLAVGKQFRHTVFDPSSMGSAPVDIVVEGKETIAAGEKHIECYRLRSTFKGIALRSWIDEEGNTLREESPLGMMLVRESKVDALTSNWSAHTRDLMAASAIPLEQPLAIANPSYLKVRLKNCSLEGLHLSAGRQELHGDTLEITGEDLSALSPCAIAADRKEMQAYLSPTPFIQSTDPSLVRQASEIIGGERDVLKAVELIREWVYHTVEKKPTLSIPSALDVLRLRVGDCNEHAVLFVALCRAAGIPSKLCAGLVYNAGSFYYHAWSEVFAGRWISVDPTMNQLPADATHIRLVEGGLDQQLEIVKLIGVLQLEVLDYR